MDLQGLAGLQQRVLQRVDLELFAIVRAPHANVGIRVRRRQCDALGSGQILELETVAATGLQHVLGVVGAGDGALLERVRHDSGDDRPIGIAGQIEDDDLGLLAQREVEALDAATVRLHHAHPGRGAAVDQVALVEQDAALVAAVLVELRVLAGGLAVHAGELVAIDTRPGMPARGAELHIGADRREPNGVLVVADLRDPEQRLDVRVGGRLVADVLELGHQVALAVVGGIRVLFEAEAVVRPEVEDAAVAVEKLLAGQKLLGTHLGVAAPLSRRVEVLSEELDVATAALVDGVAALQLERGLEVVVVGQLDARRQGGVLGHERVERLEGHAVGPRQRHVADVAAR